MRLHVYTTYTSNSNFNNQTIIFLLEHCKLNRSVRDMSNKWAVVLLFVRLLYMHTVNSERKREFTLTTLWRESVTCLLCTLQTYRIINLLLISQIINHHFWPDNNNNNSKSDGKQQIYQHHIYCTADSALKTLCFHKIVQWIYFIAHDAT